MSTNKGSFHVGLLADNQSQLEELREVVGRAEHTSINWEWKKSRAEEHEVGLMGVNCPVDLIVLDCRLSGKKRLKRDRQFAAHVSRVRTHDQGTRLFLLRNGEFSKLLAPHVLAGGLGALSHMLQEGSKHFGGAPFPSDGNTPLVS